MAAEYTVVLKTPDNQIVGRFQDFARLGYGRSLNNVGRLTLEIPPIISLGDLSRDMRIEVWRRVAGGAPYLDMETPWFLYRAEERLDNQGRFVVRLLAVDALSLLKRRIVAYPAPYPDYPSPETDKSGAIDTLIHTIMRENFTAQAGSYLQKAPDTDRDLSDYLLIGTEAGTAPTTQKQFAHQIVLDLFQALAKESANRGTDLIFDIIQTNETGDAPFLEFNTYLGQRGDDHTIGTGADPIVLSTEHGNLVDTTVALDWSDAVSRVYAAGEGEGEQRLQNMVVLENDDLMPDADDPFGFSEQFVNANNTSVDGDPVRSEAEAALERGKPRQIVSGSIVETPQTLYGRDYQYGDRLTVRVYDRLNGDGQDLDVHVTAVTVTLQERKESIKAQVSSTVVTDTNDSRNPTLNLLAHLQSIRYRLDYLETLEKI